VQQIKSYQAGERAALLRKAGTVFLVLGILGSLADSAGAQIELRPRVKQGAALRSESLLRIRFTAVGETVGFEGVGAEFETTTESSREVSDGGRLTVDVVVESLTSEFAIPVKGADPPDGINVRLSTRPDAAVRLDKKMSILGAQFEDLAAFEKAYKALRGFRYRIVVDRNGDFRRVDVPEQHPEALGEPDETAQRMVHQRFDPNWIRYNYDRARGELPTVLVKKGDSWEHTQSFNPCIWLRDYIPVNVRRRYTYTGGVQADGMSMDVIEFVAVNAEIDKRRPPGAGDVSDMRIRRFSSKGRILFSREVGQPVLREEEASLSASWMMTLAGHKIPQSVTADISTSLTKSSATTARPGSSKSPPGR
jgi:hypothetical protein